MIEVKAAPPAHYPWIAQRARLGISSTFRALEAVEHDRILGMVAYDGWTPNSCAVHVAIDDWRALRRLVRPAFLLPFRELDKGVVVASVLSTNSKSLRLVDGLGFESVGKIADGFERGVDLHIFEMRRENCRWVR